MFQKQKKDGAGGAKKGEGIIKALNEQQQQEMKQGDRQFEALNEEEVDKQILKDAK